MRISISDNGSYIVDFRQLTVHGRAAASGYAFIFLLKGERRAQVNPIEIFDIRLNLAFTGSNKPIIPIIFSSEQIIQCHNFPNNEQLHFEILLTKEQVNALEEYRREKDLNLNIGLRAMTSSEKGLAANFDSTDIVIPREQWLGALSNSGYRQTLLFEVPLPSAPVEFMNFFSKAQEFIEIGHYKETVIQCRLLIEEIEKLRDDKQMANAAANKKTATRAERENMTAIERMLSLRENLKNICQLGAHGGESFTRSQAKAVLGMTMALLAEPTVGFANDREPKKNNE